MTGPRELDSYRPVHPSLRAGSDKVLTFSDSRQVAAIDHLCRTVPRLMSPPLVDVELGEVVHVVLREQYASGGEHVLLDVLRAIAGTHNPPGWADWLKVDEETRRALGFAWLLAVDVFTSVGPPSNVVPLRPGAES